MKILSREEFIDMLRQARASKRLMRNLRYVPEEVSYPDQRDFMAIMTRSGNEGVLLLDGKVIPMSLQKRSANRQGRIEAIICDICATWQRGTNSATLTFKKSATVSISHLVCADLDCSLHVRDLTDEGRISRTQLRGHIAPKDRVDRLRERLDYLSNCSSSSFDKVSAS